MYYKTNTANEELGSRLFDWCGAQERNHYTDWFYHSNSLSNKMDKCLLAVRGINHKYIVLVESFLYTINQGVDQRKYLK